MKVLLRALALGLLIVALSSLVAPVNGWASPAGAATGGSATSGPLWYRIEIDGAPAGWATERIERTDKQVTTASRMELHLRRGGADVVITLSSRFIETATGAPVLLRQRQALGQLPVESTFRFLPGPPNARVGGRVEATTIQAGRKTHETVPAPAGAWLTPEASRRALLAHRRAGDERFVLRTVEPFQGLEPVTTTWQRLGAGTEPGAVDRWRQAELATEPEPGTTGAATSEGAGATRSAAAGAAPESAVSTVELDADGRLVWSSTRFLGLELTQTRTDRRSALAAVDGGAAPELMVSTFVHPDRPIPSPRRLRRAVYELSLAPAGADPATMPVTALPSPPSTGAQRVTTDGDRVRLEIVVPARSDEQDATPADDRSARAAPADSDEAAGRAGVDPTPYLVASPFLDHRDPAIRALLGTLDQGSRRRPVDADPVAPGTEPQPRESPRERAARLTALVRNRITAKNLDTGFATASEVARTLSGDCTEHAVLLAALLRADGIPSRVVSGLVYLERFAGARDVFGYHMWTEALIDGRWVDLDAALPGEVDGFDATHVALAVSALDGPEAAADFVPLVGLIGRLHIAVKETRY